MPKKIDLTGQVFNCLTVIKESPKRISGHVCWLCQCSCGNPNLITVSSTHLRTGHTQSCGCLQKKAARNNNYIDITNQRFGKLIAIKDIGSNKSGNSLWKCQCDCGNTIIVKGIDLRFGHTQSCGCLNSRGEAKIKSLLNEYNIPFEIQKTFNSCKFPNTNTKARFDFYVDNKFLIEYDGIQHFESRQSKWEEKESLKKRQEKDSFKNQWCLKNGIPLIRIPYTKFETLSIEDLKLETSKYIIKKEG